MGCRAYDNQSRNHCGNCLLAAEPEYCSRSWCSIDSTTCDVNETACRAAGGALVRVCCVPACALPRACTCGCVLCVAWRGVAWRGVE